MVDGAVLLFRMSHDHGAETVAEKKRGIRVELPAPCIVSEAVHLEYLAGAGFLVFHVYLSGY